MWWQRQVWRRHPNPNRCSVALHCFGHEIGQSHHPFLCSVAEYLKCTVGFPFQECKPHEMWQEMTKQQRANASRVTFWVVVFVFHIVFAPSGSLDLWLQWLVFAVEGENIGLCSDVQHPLTKEGLQCLQAVCSPPLRHTS